MFWHSFLLILMTLRFLETTRVSRIKPPFLNHRPDLNGRYSTASPVVALNSNHEQTTKYPTNDHALMGSAPTAVNPFNTRTRSCEKPYSCVNCTTYRLCVPSDHGFIEMTSGTCPSDRPYCDNYSGTCVNSAAVAVRCATPDKNFHCMRDGHFPHPVDPAKYFICSDLKAYGYSCKEGYKYYAPSQDCSKFSWIANPFDCSDLNATKVLYNNGGSFFAYCVNGQPYIISSCVENEFFNITSQVCEPQCTKELIAPDNNNCIKYFKCFKNPSTNLYEKKSLNCPIGEGFNGSLKRCVPLNQLPACKLTS